MDKAGEGQDTSGAGGGDLQEPIEAARRALADLEHRTPGDPGLILGKIFEILGAMQDLDQLLAKALDLVGDAIGCDRGVVLLKDRQTGRLEVAAARGVPQRAQLRALEVSRTVIREVVRTGRMIASGDATADQQLRDRESIRLHEIRGLCCIPLVAEGNVFGALYVDRLGEPGSCPPETKLLLQHIAGCVSMAVHNAWLQQDQARANARLHERNLELAQELADRERSHELIGSSWAVQRVRQAIERTADAYGSVLLVGGTGAGKRHVARALHVWSARHAEPYLSIDLRDAPNGLGLRQLFGAAGAAAGLLARVQSGTLLVAGIVHAERELQDALVEVIEDRRIRTPGGGEAGAEFKGRLVFTTDQDPHRAMREGRLRDELYQRITTSLIEVPPLAERRQDIPLLIEHFVQQYRQAHGGEGEAPSAEFIEASTRFDWPRGNVGELREVVERGLAGAQRAEDWMVIYREHVAGQAGAPLAEVPSYHERVREFERSELTKALRAVDWNQAAAARLLSMPEATFRYKVKTLNIEIPD